MNDEQPSAVLFDFDGVVVDTETPLYLAWRQLFRDFGAGELGTNDWTALMLTDTQDYLAPLRRLEAIARQSIADSACAPVRREIRAAYLEKEPVRPGILAALEDLRNSGVPVALVTSSARLWVEQNVPYPSFLTTFDAVICSDHGEVKPSPNLYLHTCRALSVDPTTVIAVEDSPRGVEAAKNAGIFCVGFPTMMTKGWLERADLIVDGPTFTLIECLEEFSCRRS